MYILTAHMTLIGVDEESNLTQLCYSDENLPRLVPIEAGEDRLIVDGPLSGFEIRTSPKGTVFVKNDKYLCAVRHSSDLVADREVAQLWETFWLVSAARARYFATINQGSTEEMARFRLAVLDRQTRGEPVKLYCGAGHVPRPGFLNLDVEVLAPWFLFSRPEEYFVFPFANLIWELPDNCVDYVFHEDFIEHVPQLMQLQFLAEALRVMKPGSWHRINTPNLITAMKKFSRFEEGYRGVYTGEQRMGHISIFSPASLKEMAELVGYREVVFTTRNHGVSPYAENDFRPGPDMDEVLGNIYADLLK